MAASALAGHKHHCHIAYRAHYHRVVACAGQQLHRADAGVGCVLFKQLLHLRLCEYGLCAKCLVHFKGQPRVLPDALFKRRADRADHSVHTVHAAAAAVNGEHSLLGDDVERAGDGLDTAEGDDRPVTEVDCPLRTCGYGLCRGERGIRAHIQRRRARVVGAAPDGHGKTFDADNSVYYADVRPVVFENGSQLDMQLKENAYFAGLASRLVCLGGVKTVFAHGLRDRYAVPVLVGFKLVRLELAAHCAAAEKAAAEARARRAAESELDPDLELCATRTIKISRADLEQAMAAQQAAKQQEQPNPEPPAAPQPEPLPKPEPPANLPKPKASILDDDIPDFSAGLDPAALEAARKADEKAPPRSTDEFQRAASQLFEDDEDDGEDEEPTITFPGRSKAKPAVPRPLAAKQEPKQDAIHNRSLAMIERAERRHRRKAIAAVAVIALLVLVGAAVLLGLTRGCTVEAPAYKNYGTEQFDTQAQAYLKSAAAENEKIIGYLAFPGQNGQLVYSGSQPGDGAAISGTNYLNASMPSNTVLSCADASLASLTDQTNFSQNAEFTLYLSDVTYHFRAVAVYNTDAAGTENAFTPASYGELSDYYSYAEFSQSIKERSLFDTGNTPGDKETFLTLMSTGGTNSTFVCVTAVLLPDQAQ